MSQPDMAERKERIAKHSKVKNYALVFCLFVFLFVTIGGGLHMNPGGAFLAAASGTPLMIYAFNRKSKGNKEEDREC